MDKSNGYEGVALRFINDRGRAIQGVGTSAVRQWARTLSPGSTVLDIGCGTGIPISNVLIDEGLTVYGIDASPTLVNTFRQNFPTSPVICESVEDSSFFNRQFKAIIAWGLLFLLPEKSQALVLQKAANALQTGGKLLFTSPYQSTQWQDVMTEQGSLSLGGDAYKALLFASGLALLEEFEDEGENHYFSAVKR